MDKTETVKVVLRKSGIAPNAKSIDLESLRKILEKAQNKQRTAQTELKRTTHALTESNQLPTSESYKLKVQSSTDGKKDTPEKENATSETSENSGEYACCFCDHISKEDEEYRKHISTHIKNKALRCNMCSFSADKISTYNEHIKEAHQKPPPIKTAYACSICSFKSLTMEELLKHKASAEHSGKKPFHQCRMCGHKEIEVHKMLQHIMKHSRDAPECKLCNNPDLYKGKHDKTCPEVISPYIYKYDETVEPLPKTEKKLFTCTLCDFQCKKLLFLVEHVKAHAKHRLFQNDEAGDDGSTEDYPFCCTMCDYRCVRPSRLSLHMKTHGPGTIYRCKSCDFESKDIAQFRAHRKTHSGPTGNLLSCFVCLMKFTKQEHLKLHMMSHTTSKPYSCRTCEYKCMTKTRLLLHEKTHSKKKTHVFFPCPSCPNKYPTSDDLRRHLKTHGSDGKYQCEYCNYNCYTSDRMRIHMQKHLGAQKFRCEVCHDTFPTESLLKVHIRDHLSYIDQKSTTRRNVCNICKLSFATKARLTAHVVSHSNEFPHICPICSSCFKEKTSRDRHITVVHSKTQSAGIKVPTTKNSIQNQQYMEVNDDQSLEVTYLGETYEFSDSFTENIQEGEYQLVDSQDMEVE